MVKANNSGLKQKLFSKVRPLYPEVYLSDKNISDILESAHSEDELRTIFKYLSTTLKSSPNHAETGELLFNAVDASKYDLSQWIEAIHYFDNWLINEGRKTELKTMLGYINCCNDSPENKTISYRLIDILKHMLEEHGYEG